MEKEQHSPKYLKQRKFLLVLPLLALPFTFIIFVALGGGKGSGVRAHEFSSYQGINLKLPDPHFKKGKEKDKLGLYEEAGKDSAKIKEAIKNDPFYRPESHEGEKERGNNGGELQTRLQQAASKYDQAGPSKLKTSVGSGDADPNEEKVMAKLALLKSELDRKTQVNSHPSGHTSHAGYPISPDLANLENMMKAINAKDERDPELGQLSSMLDKIMLIQHPEKLQDSLNKVTAKNQPESFSATTETPDGNISTFNNIDTSKEKTNNDFYDLADQASNEIVHSNAIEAVISETQTLVSGSVVKFRLLQDIYVHGSLIPKDQLIYGVSSLSNERLKITIHSIRNNSILLPVVLDVYDMDGLEGIYIPGSINRDLSKESVDQAMGSIGITSLDPSLGAQAASASIQAAKTLMSRKIKLVRFTVKAGFRVLLKDEVKK